MAAERCRFCYSFPLGRTRRTSGGYGEDNASTWRLRSSRRTRRRRERVELRAAASSERPPSCSPAWATSRRGSQSSNPSRLAPPCSSGRVRAQLWRVHASCRRESCVMGESSAVMLSPDGSAPDCFRHWAAAGSVAVEDSAVVRVLRRNHPGAAFPRPRAARERRPIRPTVRPGVVACAARGARAAAQRLRGGGEDVGAGRRVLAALLGSELSKPWFDSSNAMGVKIY